MKQFKIGISAMVLLLAIGTSFAFRNADKKDDDVLTCVWYDYNGTPGNEHDPTQYSITVTPPPTCPGTVDLCAICVDISEIYGPTGAFPLLPIVDNENTVIYNIINNALLDQEDIYMEELNTAVELEQ